MTTPDAVTAARLGQGCALAAAVATAVLVCWRLGSGFDLSDESALLLAADPPARGAAYNGMSGLYLRPLWQATGWSVAGVRAIGIALLIVAALALGQAVARLVEGRRLVVQAVVVASALGYYGLGLRTPSYNWLALVGALLVCTGWLRLLAEGRPAWGALAGAGIGIAAAGKLTTGAGLCVLVTLGLLRRPRALGWAAVALAAVAAAHVAFVLTPAQTFQSLRRSAAMLAALDPGAYTVGASLVAIATGLVLLTARASAAGGLTGLAPLVLTPFVLGRSPVRTDLVVRWVGALSALAVAAATAIALGTGAWGGGAARWLHGGGGPVPVVLAVGVLAAVGVVLRLDHPSTGRALLACLVLLAAAGCYALGSDLTLGVQLSGAAGLVAAAALLACHALPRAAASVTTHVVVGCLCVGAVLTAREAQTQPYRSASWAMSTVAVQLGPATVRVDPQTAGALDTLAAAAARAGWRRGMPLLDIAFTPAVPLLLRARVPQVLLPGLPGTPLEATCQALHGEGPAWRDAWLLVPHDLTPAELRRLGGMVGRDDPRDYVVVATLDTPWVATPVTLLAPRPQLDHRSDTADPTDAAGCLT